MPSMATDNESAPPPSWLLSQMLQLLRLLLHMLHSLLYQLCPLLHALHMLLHPLSFFLYLGLALSPSLLPRIYGPRSSATTQIAIWIAPDYLQDVLWPIIARVLEYAAYEACSKHGDISKAVHVTENTALLVANGSDITHKAIRKSDSLAALCKGLVKLPSAMVTGALILIQCRINWWCSWLFAFVTIATWCILSFYCQSSTVRETQKMKGRRDDAV